MKVIFPTFRKGEVFSRSGVQITYTNALQLVLILKYVHPTFLSIEREQSMYTGSRPAQNIVLPSAPRASIDADVYERTVPYEGPFMAYLSNLSFDIAEDEIYEFFEELKVRSIFF